MSTRCSMTGQVAAHPHCKCPYCEYERARAEAQHVRAKEFSQIIRTLTDHRFVPQDAVDSASKIIREVSHFNIDMTEGMLDALTKGKEGWDDPDSAYWNGNFEIEILKRVMMKVCQGAEGNEVDIANYMMMLKYLREQVAKKRQERGG